MGAFQILTRLKGLRGSRFDIFGFSQERRQERKDLEDYLQCLDVIVKGIGSENYATAVQLAGLPARLRGFGHVRQRNREQLLPERQRLLAALKDGSGIIPVFEPLAA